MYKAVELINPTLNASFLNVAWFNYLHAHRYSTRWSCGNWRFSFKCLIIGCPLPVIEIQNPQQRQHFTKIILIPSHSQHSSHLPAHNCSIRPKYVLIFWMQIYSPLWIICFASSKYYVSSLCFDFGNIISLKIANSIIIVACIFYHSHISTKSGADLPMGRYKHCKDCVLSRHRD